MRPESHPFLNPLQKMSHFSNSLRCLGTIALLLFLTSSSHGALTQKRPSFAKKILAPQNAARALVRMQPLVWDAKLTRYARWYANQRRNDCALQHSDGPYGENLFWGGAGRRWTATQAVDAWVSERQYYQYGSNSCTEGEMCGHYTQIVWSTTKRVGCARVNCSGGKGVFITCNYDPPGNYVGERPW